MKRPRLLFFHTIPFFAGGERFILELMVYLCGHGMEPWFMGRSAELAGRLRAQGLRTIFFEGRGLRRTLNPAALVRAAVRLFVFTGRLVRFIRRQRIGLLYVNSWDSLLLVLAAGRLTRTPIVFHCHEIIEPRPVTRAVFRTLGPRVDVVIGVSDAVTSHLVRRLGVSAGRVRRIHNGVDPERWPAAPPVPERDRTVVATAGRLSMPKGQHIFVECARLVLKLRKGVEFDIVGDALEPAWFSFRDALANGIRVRGEQDRIRMKGWQRDPASALATVDIMVFPSLAPDSFPYAVLEAMAMAKPVVASAVGGIPEMVVEGETGLLVPAGDPAQLAQAVLRLVDDRPLCRRMGAAGRRRVEALFTLDRSCAEISAVIASLISSGTGLEPAG